MGVYNVKMVILIRKDLNSTHGKMIAQSAHAALGVFTERFKPTSNPNEMVIELNDDMKEWLIGSFAKIALKCDSLQDIEDAEQWAKDNNIPHKKITDNGTTQFNNIPTITCIAVGPCKSEILDAYFTPRYKLY
jgi:PTH2 family peptidyl-tRNA hydrolase